jgi:hypothetical protein
MGMERTHSLGTKYEPEKKPYYKILQDSNDGLLHWASKFLTYTKLLGLNFSFRLILVKYANNAYSKRNK